MRRSSWLTLLILLLVARAACTPQPAPEPPALRPTRTPSAPAVTATWTPSFGTRIVPSVTVVASATTIPTAPASATLASAATPTPPAGTPSPAPTPTMAGMPTPTSDHDTSVCHGAETGAGHTHGHCWFDLPPGDVFFNRPVQPDDTPFLDYAEPGLLMPGHPDDPALEGLLEVAP